MGDFTFAGKHSRAHHVRLLKSPISVLPDTRDKVIIVPGRHGSLRLPPDLAERHLRLECLLTASTTAELYGRLDGVRTWLNPLRGAQPFIFDATPDRYYTAAVTGEIEANTIARHGIFVVEMVCYDPYAYSTVSSEVNGNITQPAKTFQIVRDVGAYAVAPTIRIKNVGTSPIAGGLQIKRTAIL